MLQKPREKLKILLLELDPEGNILKLSGNPSHFSERHANDLIGQNWLTIFFPGVLLRAAEEVQKRLSQADVQAERLQAAGPVGAQILLELTTSNEYSSNGKLEKIIGAAIDVTDYDDQLSRALHAKQEMDVVQQLARIGSWSWDLQMQTLQWSDELYTIYGLDPKNTRPDPDHVAKMNHSDDRANVENIINRAIATCSKAEFDHRIIRPDGSIRFLIQRAEVITGPDGKPVRMIGTSQDITDRIKAEEKIIESERRFRVILESVQDYAIYMLAPDGTITSWNNGAQSIKGYSEADALGKNFSIFFPEEDRRDGKPKRLLKLAMENGKVDEEAWRVRKDGTRFWASVSITPIYDSLGDLIGFSKVVRDMTRRKMSEEQVQKQTDYIRLLQDIAVASNEAIRLEDALRFTLRRLCDQTGWNIGHALILSEHNPGELVSSRIWYMNDPYQFDSFRAASESVSFPAGFGIPGRVFVQSSPVWIESADQIPVSQRRDAAIESGIKTGVSFPILVGRSVAGVIECYSKESHERDEQFIQVITQIGTQLGRVIEREQSEKAIRQSEARFRTIFEGAALGIELIDLDGHILESNAAASEMVGYTIQELRELTWKDVHHPANLIGNVEFFKDLQSGKRNSFRVERPYIRKDDRLCWSRISVTLMRADDGAPQFAIGMLEDITEQRQMEAELIELQRSIMEGREAERMQLAQELHDGPVQDLYGIYFQQKSIHDHLEAHQKPAAADLQQMMTQVITKLRAICKDLRPPTLAPFGLEKAIRAHAEAFMEQNAVKIDLELMPDGQALPERIRLALFRIYQQTIVNVMRHAQATHVKVRFSFNEKEIILEIEDDGEGFIVPDKWIELARQGHMGLVGAAERAEAIGGKLSIESDPQRGTLVRVVAPRNYSGLKNISGG